YGRHARPRRARAWLSFGLILARDAEHLGDGADPPAAHQELVEDGWKGVGAGLGPDVLDDDVAWDRVAKNLAGDRCGRCAREPVTGIQAPVDGAEAGGGGDVEDTAIAGTEWRPEIWPGVDACHVPDH